MLKCADCGSLNKDNDRNCGVCGSTALYPPDKLPQSTNLAKTRRPRRNPASSIVQLTIGLAVLAVGASLIFGWVLVPISIILLRRVIGFYMMLFGAVILLSLFGVFGDAPYHGWAAWWWGARFWRELDQKQKEKDEYSD